MLHLVASVIITTRWQTAHVLYQLSRSITLTRRLTTKRKRRRIANNKKEKMAAGKSTIREKKRLPDERPRIPLPVLEESISPDEIEAERIPRKEYSPHRRTQIITAHKSGVPAATIAELHGISKGCVHAVIKRYKHRNGAENAPRSGRPPKLGECEVRKVLRLIADNPYITYKDMIQQAQLQCTARTLKRHLEKKGVVHSRRPASSPLKAEPTRWPASGSGGS